MLIFEIFIYSNCTWLFRLYQLQIQTLYDIIMARFADAYSLFLVETSVLLSDIKKRFNTWGFRAFKTNKKDKV